MTNAASGRIQHAGGLANGSRHVSDVHQRVVGHHEIEGGCRERQGGGVSQFIAAAWVRVPRVSK